VDPVVPTQSFDERALKALPPAPDFVRELREQAFAEYTALPIPSQETEEWRYTDLSAFELDFESRPPRHTLTTSNQQLDGAGIVFCDLDRAAEEYPDLVEPALHGLVPTDRTTFTALHGAFRTGGTFLYVPPDVRIELPLQCATSLHDEGTAVFPHTVLVADRGADVTLIDRFVSPDLSRAFSDAIAEIYVGDGAHVRYASIQEWGSGVTHLGIQRATVGRDAEFRSLAIGFGASLARAEAETVLAGTGGFSEMLGVFFADGTQHFDHRSVQDHAAPHCTSDLLYKGALRDASRAVYSGWVHVRAGAQKTDAMQTSRNIVLSEHAKADAIPNLEIEANDVRCGHAASVGPVEEETLFYLESRGIPRAEAERLIVTGFFQEVLDRVRIEDVRRNAELAIQEELGVTHLARAG
jgi:Fe-S cluster assembly protein SufD